MFRIRKEKNRDFTILNLSDVQLGIHEWYTDLGKITKGTILELVEREKPDLITTTGDVGWAHYASYECFCEFMETICIPWTTVWGNHDCMRGDDNASELADRLISREHCIFEKGDRSLGVGNFVILIEEEDRPVEALVMMDTHDSITYTDDDGLEQKTGSRLIPAQIRWYCSQMEELERLGCGESCVFMHVAPYVYETAFYAAYDGKKDPMDVDAHDTSCWNPGYEKAFGVLHEPNGVCATKTEDGFFDAVKKYGSTRYITAGHCHTNSFAIPYDGVWLTFALKTGPGCYWEPALNGGTVYRISSDGVSEFYHSYVDSEKFLR